MPEGDSLHRTARSLASVLVGQRVTGFRACFRRACRSGAAAFAGSRMDTRSVVGRSIVDARAEGKNLLIEFDDGRTLYTHMRMTGSWHLYRPGEAWRMPSHLAVVVLEAGTVVAVCFRAPVVELLSAAQARLHPSLANLGPDIVADDFDERLAIDRLVRLDGHKPVADALLDQRAVAGIGNIYKSETLFVSGVEPRRLVDSLSTDELRQILTMARKLMRSNLDTVARRTRGGPLAPVRPGDRFYVYRRSGRPCRQCRTPIVMIRGEEGRSTYFCPTCQRAK